MGYWPPISHFSLIPWPSHSKIDFLSSKLPSPSNMNILWSSCGPHRADILEIRRRTGKYIKIFLPAIIFILFKKWYSTKIVVDWRIHIALGIYVQFFFLRALGFFHTPTAIENYLKSFASVFSLVASIIISIAWDDGKIRVYTPQTGKLKYTIHDAHSKGVTALATTSTSQRIISGGGEGQVRVWDVSDKEQQMRDPMKEHKGWPLTFLWACDKTSFCAIYCCQQVDCREQ